jgi:adenylate kinase family enzyme
MNIVEAFIKFKGQLIIVISGINGCGKSEIANDIAHDFKLEIIDQFNFLNNDYDIKTELNDGSKIINWDSDEAIDWKLFNKEVNSKSDKGVIVIGTSFPVDNLEFNIDFHLHVSMAKKVCFDSRKKFLNEHRDKFPDDVYDKELLKFNKLTFPYYLKTLEHNKIDKYLNANNHSLDELYDQAFDYLIFMIQKWLNSSNNNNNNNNNKHDKDYDGEDEDIEYLVKEDYKDENFDPDREPDDEPIFFKM